MYVMLIYILTVEAVGPVVNILAFD